MSRFLVALTLVGLLVACDNQGDVETSGASQPTGSAGAPASAGASAGASGGASGNASAACEESFAPLAEMEISSMSDLGDLAEEVQPTIESCESVADWVAGAQQVVEEEIDPDTAAFLLRINCEDPALTNTAICEELASS
jgi:hypothetical protein